MDLGFDTNIRNIGAADVSFEFTIQGTGYRTLRLLYELGADTVTGKGTRVFEVIDQRTKEVRVIKDCWVEDHAGNQMEHEVVAGIRRGVNNDENFHKHFINICGYQKTDTSGGFDRLCKVLKTETFGGVDFRSWHTTPITDFQKPVYHPSAEDMTPNQGGYLLQTPAEHTPATPPRSRSRYQVVYDEKGISLFEVPLLADVFKYLVQATDGMSQTVPDSQTCSRCASPALLTPNRVDSSRFYARKCHCSWDDSKDFGLRVRGMAGSRRTGGTDEAKGYFARDEGYPYGRFIFCEFDKLN